MLQGNSMQYKRLHTVVDPLNHSCKGYFDKELTYTWITQPLFLPCSILKLVCLQRCVISFLLSSIVLMALGWSLIVVDFLSAFMILQEASIFCPFVSKYFLSYNRIFCRWENPKPPTWWTCPQMFELTSSSFYGPGNTMHRNMRRMVAF
jgi:hypothetical protein